MAEPAPSLLPLLCTPLTLTTDVDSTAGGGWMFGQLLLLLLLETFADHDAKSAGDGVPMRRSTEGGSRPLAVVECRLPVTLQRLLERCARQAHAALPLKPECGRGGRCAAGRWNAGSSQRGGRVERWTGVVTEDSDQDAGGDRQNAQADTCQSQQVPDLHASERCSISYFIMYGMYASSNMHSLPRIL